MCGRAAVLTHLMVQLADEQHTVGELTAAVPTGRSDHHLLTLTYAAGRLRRVDGILLFAMIPAVSTAHHRARTGSCGDVPPRPGAFASASASASASACPSDSAVPPVVQGSDQPPSWSAGGNSVNSWKAANARAP